ncbi:MAG: diacylglycerol kinase family protein, partial [Clostridia bacterium]|nr:diacylglycerol kinase family protein [Clostridia bacterium]
MAKAYVFYNPLAGNGACTNDVKSIENMIDDEIVFCDLTGGNCDTIEKLDADDYIVICGGDGTLNRFINEVDVDNIKNDVLYFASGSGNDFAHDVGHARADKPYSIKKYLCDLPSVTVNG